MDWFMPKPKIEQPLPPILGAAADTELDKEYKRAQRAFLLTSPMGLMGEPVTPSSQRRTLMG
jgi:hypothetical protein